MKGKIKKKMEKKKNKKTIKRKQILLSRREEKELIPMLSNRKIMKRMIQKRRKLKPIKKMNISKSSPRKDQIG